MWRGIYNAMIVPIAELDQVSKVSHKLPSEIVRGAQNTPGLGRRTRIIHERRSYTRCVDRSGRNACGVISPPVAPATATTQWDEQTTRVLAEDTGESSRPASRGRGPYRQPDARIVHRLDAGATDVGGRR